MRKVILLGMFLLPLYAQEEILKRKVTVDVRDADLRVLLHLIARDTRTNIVVHEDVKGKVSVQLKDVPLEKALESMLRTLNFGFYLEDGVITVLPMERMPLRMQTKIFTLKYLDANDVKRFLQKELSSEKARIEVFTQAGRMMYGFGEGVTRRPPEQQQVVTKSKILSITDTPQNLARLESMIRKIDVKPLQILIDVRIAEISYERERELGIEWNFELGAVGAARPTSLPFEPKTGAEFQRGNFPKPEADDFIFGTLDASRLTATLKLLEASGDLNTLAKPTIATLENQQASILIGTRFPITVETIQPELRQTVVTLDRFENIGIQLLVLPQVVGEDYVNMIIHPAISILGKLVADRFPIISTREADTQVLIRSGQSVVIGGLIEEREEKALRSIPGLGDIPILKYFVTYKGKKVKKTDLLIFVTPRIVRERPEKVQRPKQESPVNPGF